MSNNGGFMTASEVIKRYTVNDPQPNIRPRDVNTWMQAPRRGAERRLAESQARLQESRTRLAHAEELRQSVLAELPARVAPQPVLETPEPEVVGVPDQVVETEAVDYSAWTRAQLYERAKELQIPGRSKMTKKQLRKALERQ